MTHKTLYIYMTIHVISYSMLLHVTVVIRVINCYFMILHVIRCYWLLHGLHFQSIIRYEYVFVLCSSCI